MPESTDKKRFNLFSLFKKNKEAVTRRYNADEFLKQYEEDFTVALCEKLGEGAKNQARGYLLKSWQDASLLQTATQEQDKKEFSFFGGTTFVTGIGLASMEPIMPHQGGLALVMITASAYLGLLLRRLPFERGAELPDPQNNYQPNPNDKGSKETYESAQGLLEKKRNELGLRALKPAPVCVPA